MAEPQYRLEGIVHTKSELMEDFEGPLDVILELLSKNKIEIQDVSITAILTQYLAYLEEMKRLDMEIASEFITMASHLMLIKTKMLLSAAEQAEAENELDILRQSLMERKRKEAMDQIHLVSALTHAHPISLSACGIYILIAAKLLAGMKLEDAIRTGIEEGFRYYDAIPAFAEGLKVWNRLRDVDALRQLEERQIRSGGYVVETLEAALWCLLKTSGYPDAALKAVNLGGDTDTTAAVVGGLAGLAYGTEGIPAQWLEKLAGKDTIERCCLSLRSSHKSKSTTRTYAEADFGICSCCHC